MGHGGGAAITGIIIGRSPKIIQGAILISCPCVVPEWRPEWRHSLSPHEFVSSVDPKTVVLAMAGVRDMDVAPDFSKRYIKMLKTEKVIARCMVSPYLDHNTLQDPFIRPPAKAINLC